MASEPLLFRPAVFYSLSGVGLAIGLLGLTPISGGATFANVGLSVCAGLLGAIVFAWNIKVPEVNQVGDGK